MNLINLIASVFALTMVTIFCLIVLRIGFEMSKHQLGDETKK
ncbi:MAG: hypothetical protein PHC64_00680 [Candidatus Gastranaerophilales bacterium]|nr:hypothetical protein [Candidatus Gastranaerophilales bacterium]